MSLIYKNASGQILNKKEAKAAKQGNQDYQALDSTNQIGVYEARGKRSTQEDRVIFDTIKDFDIPFEEQKSLLKETFAVMQEKNCKELDCGSTAIVSVIDQDKIVTASIGDSTAYILIFNKDGSFARAERLNTILHKADLNTAEGLRAKVIAEKKNKRIPELNSNNEWRLGDSLGVSRAIGDTGSEDFGLSHEPDVYETTYQLPPNGYGFVVAACDGLTERMSENELYNFIQLNQALEPHELAKVLVEKAIEKGSGDNVSVIVTPLNHSSENQKSKTKKIIAVTDGHGGSTVSQALSDDFLSVFRQLLPTKKPSPSYRKLASWSTEEKIAWAMSVPSLTLDKMFQTSFVRKVAGKISSFFGFPTLNTMLMNASGEQITKVALSNPRQEVLDPIFKRQGRFFSGIDFRNKFDLNDLFDLVIANNLEINNRIINDEDFLASVGNAIDTLSNHVKTYSSAIQKLTTPAQTLDKILFILEEKIKNCKDSNAWLSLYKGFDQETQIWLQGTHLLEGKGNIKGESFSKFKEDLSVFISKDRKTIRADINTESRQYSNKIRSLGYLKTLQSLNNETVYTALHKDKDKYMLKEKDFLSNGLIDVLIYGDEFLIDNILKKDFVSSHLVRAGFKDKFNIHKIKDILRNVLSKEDRLFEERTIEFLMEVNKEAVIDLLLNKKYLFSALKSEKVTQNIFQELSGALSAESETRFNLFKNVFSKLPLKQKRNVYIYLMKNDACSKDERIRAWLSPEEFFDACHESSKVSPSDFSEIITKFGFSFMEGLLKDASLSEKTLALNLNPIINAIPASRQIEIFQKLFEEGLDKIIPNSMGDSVLVSAFFTPSPFSNKAPFIRMMSRMCNDRDFIEPCDKVISKLINQDAKNLAFPIMLTLWDMAEKNSVIGLSVKRFEDEILSKNSNVILKAFIADHWCFSNHSEYSKQAYIQFVGRIIKIMLLTVDQERKMPNAYDSIKEFINSNKENRELLTYLKQEFANTCLVPLIENAQVISFSSNKNESGEKGKRLPSFLKTNSFKDCKEANLNHPLFEDDMKITVK